MGEPTFRHQIVCLFDLLKVIEVDAECNPHQHVLGSLGNLAIQSQQVGALKGLEAEIIVIIIARIIDVLI